MGIESILYLIVSHIPRNVHYLVFLLITVREISEVSKLMLGGPLEKLISNEYLTAAVY